MARKILSDLICGLRHDLIAGVRGGVAWGLAMSPPSRLTLLLEPLAADPAPRHSSPPWSEVVVRAETQRLEVGRDNGAMLVSRCRDGAASMLFLLWTWEMRLRSARHMRRLAARTSTPRARQLVLHRGGL
jgi:hypothetical protein